ncbi:FUSC family protein [Bordetella muralis]
MPVRLPQAWIQSCSRILTYAASGHTAVTRDGVRLPLQNIAAVLLAYAWMTWQGYPEIAWGAFSALFVVRASVEGTVSEAAARLMGAFIGVALGVSLVLISRSTSMSPLGGILIGVGIGAYLSARWNTLSYSLVTVTILTVAPDNDILSGAYNKSMAIVIGSLSGVAASAAVLPLSAHLSMRSNLAKSIEIYGDLLVDWAAAMNEGRLRPDVSDRPAMEHARWRANDMAYQSHAFPMSFWKRHTAHPLINDLEGLWRTVPLMKRVGGLTLSENICRRLGPALDQLAAAANEQIAGLARAVRDREAEPPACHTSEPFNRLNRIVESAMRENAFDAAELEAVELIRWVWHEVALELDRLCNCIKAADKDA